METVGIVGSGEIGSRMGRLLSDAGHPVIAWDISRDALNLAAERGAKPAKSLAELAGDSDVVITCVTDGAALRDVIESDGGLLQNLESGKTIIDTTSAEPWITQELAPLLAEKGIKFLDAPVSGGVPAAEQGKMNFMVGGDASVLQEWRPLLERMGPAIVHVGGVGHGHTMKALNMMSMAATLMATAEVLATGQAAGVDPNALNKVLNESSGGSFVSKNHFQKYILTGKYNSGFTFDLMRKDLGIARELAQRMNVTTLVGSRVVDLYDIASRTGYAGEDNTRVVNFVLNVDPEVVAESAKIEAGPKLPPLERVGFIGLGTMGSRMVGRLIEMGVVPTVYDVDQSAMDAGVAKGARSANSAAEVARNSDLLLLSLPNAEIVDRAFFGDGGIIEGIGESTKLVVADTSSSKAATTIKIGEVLRARGGDILDTPVSRGQSAAEKGTMSIMVGGANSTFDWAKPILDHLGTDIIHAGKLGSGHICKGLNNLVNSTNLIIAADVLMIGKRAGLDLSTMVEVLCQGSGGSEVLEKRYPQYIISRKFNSNFRMDLMHKDAAYGLELALLTKTPAFLTSIAVQVYAAAMAHSQQSADNTEMIKLLETWQDEVLA